MPEDPTRPTIITERASAASVTTASIDPPTLADEFLQSACTIARGRTSWTPGPGHDAEDLPWLKGATAA